ncbi:tetraacyldisaccharide 4'-kinase [Flavicella marina]|uniref:tetraacyldisaccharide 4'-kinase n=1 Tax=Flavicella marina TaxID=1475951 RepID=UPI002938D43B|nr:tetraacyldisaccharide 4'-kinase [Flavicella marina]
MFQKTFIKFLRYLLFPFSVLYALVVAVRNVFFDLGVFKQTSFDIPVIAVGNLSVGGTGKTPQIEYLIRLLEKDYRIAVLSRGYKRKTKGFVLANETTKVEDIGDEPFQYSQKFKNILVAVDADRTNGIKKLLALDASIDLILLDDAYQHRKVKASFYTLLTGYDNRFTKDFVLPTGELRESRFGVNRAHAIVVTKCPADLTNEQQLSIVNEIKPNKKQQVFFSSIEYDDVVNSNSNTIRVGDLVNYEVVLVTGIAKPKPLLDFLRSKNISFKHVEFPDHHHFEETDIRNIKNIYKEIETDNKIILTTEKDFTRLSDSVENLYALGIKTSIFSNKEFDAFVKQSIKN